MPRNIPKSYKIETQRYQLRIPNLDDIPFVFSASRYNGFNDGIMWDPPINQEELIEPLRNNIKAWVSGNAYSFTIVEKGKAQLLGRIVIRITNEANIWNVGFWTHPESQGQGIMTEALNGILKFGFEELNAIKVEADHAVWNKASEKVLKRNGMRFVKYKQQGFKKRGVWVDENMLAISREEWEER